MNQKKQNSIRYTISRRASFLIPSLSNLPMNVGFSEFAKHLQRLVVPDYSISRVLVGAVANVVDKGGFVVGRKEIGKDGEVFQTFG